MVFSFSPDYYNYYYGDYYQNTEAADSQKSLGATQAADATGGGDSAEVTTVEQADATAATAADVSAQPDSSVVATAEVCVPQESSLIFNWTDFQTNNPIGVNKLQPIDCCCMLISCEGQVIIIIIIIFTMYLLFLSQQGDAASIADMLRATAEEAMTQTGFVFDETTGMYYDHSTGFYYDSVCEHFLFTMHISNGPRFLTLTK